MFPRDNFDNFEFTPSPITIEYPERITAFTYQVNNTPVVDQEWLDQCHASWKVIHTQRRHSSEWLVEWEKTIPSGCSCPSGYFGYKAAHPPEFYDELSDFTWGFNLHNFVNKKIGHPIQTLDEALMYWRPDIRSDCSSSTREATIVTSFYNKNIERQTHCLSTWLANGFKVISVNLPQEIESLSRIFPVKFAVAEPSFSYDRPLPKIHSLLTTPIPTDLRLIINSDVEILRSVDKFLSEAPTLGIRRNYADTPMDGDIERWGIDAFLLPEKLCQTFPAIDFAIGQPMWDYWIPWHLERLGIHCRWFGDPVFFHKTHPIQWPTTSLQTGWDIIYNHYHAGEDWELWRLSQPFHDPKQKEAILKYRYSVGIENPTRATNEHDNK